MRRTNFKPAFLRFGNVMARVFGLAVTSAGCFFAAQGIYYLIYPDMTGIQGQLPLPPAFRPLLLAAVSLAIGVHFIRGEAHRPDLPPDRKPGHASTGRTHSWWTGEPLDKSGS